MALAANAETASAETLCRCICKLTTLRLSDLMAHNALVSCLLLKVSHQPFRSHRGASTEHLRMVACAELRQIRFESITCSWAAAWFRGPTAIST